MIDPKRIRSIGWLYGANQTIVLTPCLDDNMHPDPVRISRKEFQQIRHNKEAMIKKAAFLLT